MNKTELPIDSPILSVKGFHCEREGRQLISDLNLMLPPGSLCQVSGENGSGKTRFIRALVGLSSEWEGEINVDGESIRRRPYPFFSSMLYLGHQPGIKAALTPHENLKAWREFHSVTDTSIMDALDAVGLADFYDFPCGTLSAGQQRRVAIARLYITDARIWILDEPFTALDLAGVEKLERHLEGHVQRGGVVLLTTHHQLSLGCSYQVVTLGRGGKVGYEQR